MMVERRVPRLETRRLGRAQGPLGTLVVGEDVVIQRVQFRVERGTRKCLLRVRSCCIFLEQHVNNLCNVLLALH